LSGWYSFLTDSFCCFDKATPLRQLENQSYSMKKALVLFSAGSEELEAVTIVNLMRRGGIYVTLAGLDAGALRGSRGITLTPDTSLDEALLNQYDMVVLPGGQPGTQHLKADVRVLKLVQQMAKQGDYVAAICAAPAVLAAAGLLDGKRATCYPGSLDAYPLVLQHDDAVMEDGRLITSRGPGTAIDFALVLVERLVNKAKRDEVEAGLVGE
jgi:4-methyl-5(b-hydroxyethyl)-thiazole monophosphate biosynthesis